MSDTHAIPAAMAACDGISADSYARLYAQSIADATAFWARIGERLDWIKRPTRIKDVSFDVSDVHIRWYADGVLNACANCLDRHLATRGNKTAIIFEGDDPGESRRISYRELHAEVCRFANTLSHLGVTKGDRIAIYLPMIPEAAVAMLACARIGAIHVVVGSHASPAALAACLADATCKMAITADEATHGGRMIPLKANVDEALTHPGTNSVETVILVRRTGSLVNIQSPRDRWYDDLIDGQSTDCPPEPMRAEDPLFILYTADATGKPAGVLHTTGGYLVFVSYTHEVVFDLKDDDVFWCTADISEAAGHGYGIYGPLANGATSVLVDGVPDDPDAGRCWQVVDTHHVTVLCAAPDALRALQRAGDAPVMRTARQSLRVLATLGAPIDPATWEWYDRVAGGARCAMVATWGEAGTGGIVFTSLAGASPNVPGSGMQPFFGVAPALVDAAGRMLEGACAGNLVMTDSWPGQMRTIHGDRRRFIDTRFKPYPGRYCTGCRAERDADGCYRITGRVDAGLDKLLAK